MAELVAMLPFGRTFRSWMMTAAILVAKRALTAGRKTVFPLLFVSVGGFTHIPGHVRQNLESLEREGVIYADHWIEEIGDFRHVRIEFTGRRM